ncbi:PqqD family peptide modification chaperone [Rathayibacter soli]|uniref:PqqD family peptide modification chaperone n=1 Tax=Rathayibacter soli TaxID=3144168 RepID=UPI0027E495FB|nr:PqqD family peptide modification chaperone [Glaciibacter superstes]
MTSARPAPGVAWMTLDDTAYVARMPSGPIIVLGGPAAVIWDELATDGDFATLTARVAERMTDVPSDADATVMDVVASLSNEGLLSGVGDGTDDSAS